MYTNLSNDLVRLAKENGWRVVQEGCTIILSKGRSVIECPDRKRAIEYLITKNI